MLIDEPAHEVSSQNGHIQCWDHTDSLEGAMAWELKDGRQHC
jgi:hypothetical protein